MWQACALPLSMSV